MKPEELRIGNIVFSKINKSLKVVQCIPGINIDDLEPVKLTEEILFEYGFKKKGACFEKNGIELFNIADLYFRAQHPIKIDLKYMHQLQNLYFSISGYEIEKNISDGK